MTNVNSLKRVEAEIDARFEKLRDSLGSNRVDVNNPRRGESIFVDDESIEKLFEVATATLHGRQQTIGRRTVAEFLLRLYGSDHAFTSVGLESALSDLVEETLAVYEQLTGNKHRLVRGLYVQVDGADEQGPFDQVCVTGHKLLFGNRGAETVLALWRGDRNRWEPPSQPGAATGAGFTVVAATARSDHFEIVAEGDVVIGCCTEAGQASVLEEEPGVRFRLVEPEFCQSCS